MILIPIINRIIHRTRFLFSAIDADADGNTGSKFKDCSRPRDESPESKKARKKAIKEAQSDKRQQKVKKHIKKRKEKMGTKK